MEKRQARIIALVGVTLAAAVGVAAVVLRVQGTGASAGSGIAAASVVPSGAASGDAAPWRPVFDTQELAGYTAGAPLRPMDQDVFAALQSGSIERQAVLDLYPDRPYRVRLYGSAETQQFRLALIDLDRNGTWDERWDFSHPGEVRRELTGAKAGDPWFSLAHGRWQAH